MTPRHSLRGTGTNFRQLVVHLEFGNGHGSMLTKPKIINPSSYPKCPVVHLTIVRRIIVRNDKKPRAQQTPNVTAARP